MPTGFRLGELAERVGGRVLGDPERLVRGVATLENAGPEQLSFLTNPRYRKAARATRAGAILVGPGFSVPGRDLLEAPEPYLALAEILEAFHPPPPTPPGISPDARLGERVELGTDVGVGPYAVIGDDVKLGDRVVIGAGSVIGERCSVGDDSALRPRVVLYPDTRIGERCLIHSGVVLGSDGFGFATSRGRHHKVPQLGRVVLEDEVEIGANSTVDRGTLEETVVGKGTKIDNLVMVAHGVRIGENCLVAAQSGLAGSARVGARVTIAAQSGAAGHLEISDDVTIAAKTAVFNDLAPGAFVAGVPAVDHRTWKRSQALAKRMPELRAEIRSLKARLAELEARLSPKE